MINTKVGKGQSFLPLGRMRQKKAKEAKTNVSREKQ